MSITSPAGFLAAMKARDKARKDSISALIQAVKKAGIDAGCREDIPEEMVNKVSMSITSPAGFLIFISFSLRL